MSVLNVRTRTGTHRGTRKLIQTDSTSAGSRGLNTFVVSTRVWNYDHDQKARAHERERRKRTKSARTQASKTKTKQECRRWTKTKVGILSATTQPHHDLSKPTLLGGIITV